MIFADAPARAVDYVEFHVARPIKLSRYEVILSEDSARGERATKRVRLFASKDGQQYDLASEASIQTPYTPHYGDGIITVSDPVGLEGVQVFRIEFERARLSGLSGPRVWEIQAFGSFYPHGDVNTDDQVDARDLDLLLSQMGGSPWPFDLTRDGSVNQADLNFLVQQVLQTRPGDANLDGRVDLRDFLILKNSFGATQEAGWADASFDGDGAVELSDFLLLKEHFGYVRPARISIEVPEPSSAVLGMVATALLWCFQQLPMRGRQAQHLGLDDRATVPTLAVQPTHRRAGFR